MRAEREAAMADIAAKKTEAEPTLASTPHIIDDRYQPDPTPTKLEPRYPEPLRATSYDMPALVVDISGV